ncbi:MAG: xanthine dehydrogenase family protein subunit M [Anaerolineales bacterium]|jgi:carbon-monoxide dehydrogenase medium subunit
MDVVSSGLPEFDYVRAESMEQVSALLLDESRDCRLFMGGTDLLVQMRAGARSPGLLVDVKHLPGMNSIQLADDGSLNVGAAVNLNTLAQHAGIAKHFALLAEAAQSVGSYQLRSRATIGGNLCNASPAADTAPATLVLGAQLIAQNAEGKRRIPAEAFFIGPGEHVLQQGEILTRIEFPPPHKRSAGRYLKLGRNAAGDLAIVGVAALGFPDETAPSGFRFRLALSSVAPTPLLVPEVEDILASEVIDDERIDTAAKAAQQAAKPIDDVRATAEYRSAMVEVYARRALQAVWTAIGRDN